MINQIQEIVETLPRLENVNGVRATAEHRLAEGDAAFLADLGIALDKRYASHPDMWQYRSVFDHLLRLLATSPGRGNVEQALRLVSGSGSRHRKPARYTASLLASNQTPEALTVVFAGGGSVAGAGEELRACLVHEMALRGVAVAETPGISGWATSPHWSRHPLGWLPLRLSPVEENPDLPSYSAGGSSYSIPYGPSQGPGTRPGSTGLPVPSAAETTTEPAAEAISAAVANWAEESNGRFEARTFDLTEPLETGAVPALLMALGLACLDGSGRSGFSVWSCPPSHAWRVLFAAASTGGAYNSGCHGAYGRLAAWRSLAGLSGAPEGASAAEVERRVRECAWFGFDGATPWFDQVAWDIGLAALTPDGRHLAVLAATDTD
ncbi:hypothetical protein PS9374_06569 [Planomonospora sphaerica]|uniref:Uncharacterized protein n=1 Tax=Planomonospora sphaerica TaxID=161355 RepID=A0A171DP97_9ACTN|nr:DUF6183 family protein [Planomonospora sphaerica]GAT70881.1 hypothetical protein PS9374_06569 [Planomonospora sphaerica]